MTSVAFLMLSSLRPMDTTGSVISAHLNRVLKWRVGDREKRHCRERTKEPSSPISKDEGKTLG